MVSPPFAPFPVALGKSCFTHQTDTLTMPKGHHEIYPFLAPVSPVRAGKQFIHSRKGFVCEGNEIVLQRCHVLHVEVVLTGTQFQLLTGIFHRYIFPQIHPVVKGILGYFHGVCLVGFYLADRATATLLDE